MLFHDPELARRFSSGSEFGCVLGTERDHRALGRFRPAGDVAPRLGSIALPTLVIWGDIDVVERTPAPGERSGRHGFQDPEAVPALGLQFRKLLPVDLPNPC